MSIDIRLKRGLKADLPSSAPAGQPLVTTDTAELYIGTGAALTQITDVIFSATEPTVEQQAKLWIDTVNNIVKRYDGDAWVALSEHVDLTPYATKVYADGKVAAEATLRSDADVALQANIDAEEAARLVAETALGNLIASEVTNRTNADATEKTARENADAAFATALTGEEQARVDADGLIVSNLASAAAGKGASTIGVQDVAGLFAATTVEAALAEIRQAHIDEFAAISLSLSTEISTNATSDANLTTAITNEVTRATAAEVALAASITSSNSGVATEVADRIAAVAALQTLVDDRYTKAQVDTKFTDLVNAAPVAFDTLGEIAAQLAADGTAATAIVNALATETTRATTAEGIIAANLVTEIADRGTAEAAIIADVALKSTTVYVDATFIKKTDVIDGGTF